MALRNAFENVASEDAVETMIYLLNAILEKMARVDVNDRAVVYLEGGTMSTVTAVTTVATLTDQSLIGGKPSNHVVPAMANAGAMHIYNQIEVTP